MIHGLHELGFHKIAVMDDGSSDDWQKYFQEVEIMGVKVIHHSKKMGKGVALRSALRLADEKIGESDFYITADCDGQYSPEDIEKVAKELLENPDCFVLGVRTYWVFRHLKAMQYAREVRTIRYISPLTFKYEYVIQVH